MKELVMILLGVLANSVQSQSNEALYVRPSEISEDCPTNGQPCKTLNHYRDNSETYFKGNELHLIFLSGSYHSSSDVGIKVFDKKTLLIESLTDSSRVVFNSLEMVYLDIDNIIIHGLTIEEVVLSVTTYSQRCDLLSDRGKVFIINSTFVQSSVLFECTNVKVQDSHFMNYRNYYIYSEASLELDSSTITFFGNISFVNNTGNKGGAMLLKSSEMVIKADALIQFQNNSAAEFGGAIFVDNKDLCFYEVLQQNKTSKILFNGNKAAKGGDNIFGASLMSDCNVGSTQSHRLNSSEVWHNYFKFNNHNSLSLVSAEPTRVCLCDSNGQPKCAKEEYIWVKKTAFPGETLTLSLVLVGGDFGATTGTMYSLDSEYDQYSEVLAFTEQTHTIVQNKQCTPINYTLLNKSKLTSKHTIILHTTSETGLFFYSRHDIQSSINTLNTQQEIDIKLRNSRLSVSIYIIKCPLGFTLYEDYLQNIQRCNCYRNFKESNNDMVCTAEKGTGYISWNSNAWLKIMSLNIADNNQTGVIMIGRGCLPSRCLDGYKRVDVINNSDSQCAFNHAGRLCGGCKDGYSLAIGSSHCIYCPNNNNLALLIFFAAAGFLLVFLISIFNLTVTQGMINGLIFYANIVRVYCSSFSPWIILNTFVAWLNLDFGIETCFYKGLNSFTTKWFHLIFPFYVAIIFFVGIKFSNKLSRICGNRSVPTLVTILFLSSTKLLNIITATLRLATISTYSEITAVNNERISVWAEDGRLEYGHHPHIYLLVVSLVFLVFLWIPYTLLLFSMQWLRTIDHYPPLKMIARYKPVYDAYFAPLKDQHHYWFGTLLLARGVLFIISSLIQSNYPTLNIYILIAILVVILVYSNYAQVYKKKSISIIESSFIINLILSFTGTIFFKNSSSTIFNLSIGVAFAEFSGMVIWNLLPEKVKRFQLKKATGNLGQDQMTVPLNQLNEEQSHKCTYSVVTTDNIITYI